MGRYGATAQVSTVSAKPQLCITSDGNVFAEVVLLSVGFSSTPADNQHSFGLYEITDAGTGGTAITPKKIGHAATSGMTCKKGTYSADPTKTGIAMITLPVYQRSTNTKVRAFGEGWKPETLAANRGLSLWCDVAGAAMNGESTMEWYE